MRIPLLALFSLLSVVAEDFIHAIAESMLPPQEAKHGRSLMAENHHLA